MTTRAELEGRPPAPLGLDDEPFAAPATQEDVDRIETKLDAILIHLGVEPLPEELAEALDADDERDERPPGTRDVDDGTPGAGAPES